MHTGFAAEPGQLALRVIAVTLLGGSDGRFPGQLAIEELDRLAVAKGIERSCEVAVTFDEAARFFDEAVGEHGFGAEVNAGVERLAFGIETDAENAKSGEGITTLLLEFGHRPAGAEADLNRADELGGIVGVDFSRGLAIESGEHAMEVTGTARGLTFAESCAQ